MVLLEMAEKEKAKKVKLGNLSETQSLDAVIVLQHRYSVLVLQELNRALSVLR